MELVTVFIFFLWLEFALLKTRTALQFARSQKSSEEMRSPERFLIHLAEFRLQLFAITRNAGLASIILETTTSVWRKMRWNVARRDRNLGYQIALQGVKHNISRTLTRCVDLPLTPGCVLGRLHRRNWRVKAFRLRHDPLPSVSVTDQFHIPVPPFAGTKNPLLAGI